MRLTTFAAALLSTAAFSVVLPSEIFAQPADAPATPRELSKVRAEFKKVRDRMEAVQREFDRAARINSPTVRDEALKDWQRALDGVEPYVSELSENVPEEKALIDEYQEWLLRYAEAAGTGNAGDFFLQITRHWTDLTAGTEGWEDEATPVTYETLTKANSGDSSVQSMGMPKTVAFVTAVNKYIQDVTTRDDYPRYKGAENVKNDLKQVTAARDRAQEKLAKAADALITQAEQGKLDQASRDKLDRYVEQDLSAALAGSESQATLQTRGRAAVRKFDVDTIGEEKAAEKSMVRLTTAAEREWPRILATYAATPMAPVGSGRGQVVKITGVRNRVGKEFQDGTYDFAGYVNGAPVVGNYAPAVKEHVKYVLEQTGQKTLPDTDYELIAVVRGTAQVPAVKRPGATTAPAAADEAAATTSPAVTDAAVLDIVALRAGPACVGTKAVVTPQR